MKCRILVVEDSATQAEALLVLLEEQGHEVLLARTAEQALERVADTDFDLVLSDIVMPGMSGYELCRTIKQGPRGDSLPVVLLTSLNDPMDIVGGLECGADNYITKPYDPEHLVARIRHVLDNRRLRRHAKTSLGVNVSFMGRDLTITSDREQILDLFISSVEDVVRANEALQRSQRELAEAHVRLEEFAREKAREARISTERYRVLLQNAGDAIFVLDLNGRVLEVNQGASDLLGRSPEEFLRLSLLDMVAAEERAFFRDRLARLPQEGRVRLAERRLLDAAGGEIWCDLTASLTPLEGEHLVLVIARDVTERRVAGEELRRRERQLSEAQQIAAVGSWEYDPRADEVIWSDQAYRTFGLERPAAGELTFAHFLERVHPEDRDAVLRAVAATLRHHVPLSEECRIVWRDGAVRTVHARGEVDLDPDGIARRLVGTVQDITERKEAERAVREREAAEQASHAKSEFLSRMSHELRTPLNAILGFAQLLEMDELPQEQSESVEQILRGGRHLLGLINEVLDLSRIEAGRISLSLEPVSVEGVLHDALSLVHPLAAQRGITLEADTSAVENGYVQADQQRLKQVVLNFISNAVKYNQAGGTATAMVTPVGADRLRIAVRDTGPGIPADKLGKLFVPFERLGADASGTEGTGLGLVLAKGLTEAMGGRVGVESTPGEGSTFWVELARAEPDSRAPASPTTGGARAATDAPEVVTRTVLYIEDNPSNLRLVERVLNRPGLRLLTAIQGSLGLELAREHRPDLILLDLNLPDIPGEEVLERLRAYPALRETPVIVVSADAMPQQAERLMRAGACEYLTKPFDVSRFLSVVDAALGQ